MLFHIYLFFVLVLLFIFDEIMIYIYNYMVETNLAHSKLSGGNGSGDVTSR